MQAIMETLFDIFYLTSVITLGILMASRKQAQKTISPLWHHGNPAGLW